MELLLGSHVREHGARVGRLAGFELEPATHRIRRIVVSADGQPGPHATSRPLAAVATVHRDGEIELRTDFEPEVLPAVRDVVLLTGATRLLSGSYTWGRLVGIDVEPATRTLLAVSGRQRWWSRRVRFDAASLDCSTPGAIRTSVPGRTRAA
jgi:hypothetical protein